MSNKIPLAYADIELQLATAIPIGGTSFTLSSATDDDGNALPAGKYCFTVDNGTSNKEYFIGQLNGTAVTSVVSVSRQGVETSGAVRPHRVGASAIVTDFATIQRVADILRGQETLDGAAPVSYDTEPTLTNREELATVGYVLDTINGGTVAFDNQVITNVNAGESVTANNLLYFKTSDQEWYLTDADTAATVNGVQLGFALGTGSDGVSISGGVQIAGVLTTSGLTAGSTYYASNTAGAISTSAGTNSRVVGLALSTTRLLIIPINPESLTDDQVAALAGAGATPNSSNKFLTTGDIDDNTIFIPPTVVTFTASGTWTKDAGLKYIVVEAVGGGGGSEGTNDAGAGSGGYSRKVILAASLGATETVTVGAGGAASGGATGSATTFGSHVTANGGTGTQSAVPGSGGTATGGDVNITGARGGSTDGTANATGGHSVLGAYGKGGNSNAAGSTGVVIVTEYYS